MHGPPDVSSSFTEVKGILTRALAPAMLLVIATLLWAQMTMVNEVRVGILLPMFLGSRHVYSGTRHAVYQALREVQNRSDGVADDLLPNTTLLFTFTDSKCDGSTSVTGVHNLMRSSFGGAGVHAIIGAACSGASQAATVLAGGLHTPMISPSSTSPTLSDGKAYPYFLRTVPSDALGARCLPTHSGRAIQATRQPLLPLPLLVVQPTDCACANCRSRRDG